MALATGMAFAAYPDKPIKIIVAFPPGSSTDTLTRLVAQQMSVAFGQSVVVENRPGASGNIATTFVSKQPGDGYTLLMHSVAIAVNPSLYAKAGYDVNKDLEAVAITGVSPNIFFVHPDVKAKTLAGSLGEGRVRSQLHRESHVATLERGPVVRSMHHRVASIDRPL